jgi:hypothetical protein
MATWRRIALEKLAAYPDITHELSKGDPLVFMCDVLSSFARSAKEKNNRAALAVVYEYVAWAETECKSEVIEVMASAMFYEILFGNDQRWSRDSPTVLDFFGIDPAPSE